MASQACGSVHAASPDAEAEAQQDAAKMMMDMVFGAGILAAVHEGFRKGGDYRGVVPLLGKPTTANVHVRAATQAAFVAACSAGATGVAGMFLAHAGVDGDIDVAKNTGIGCRKVTSIGPDLRISTACKISMTLQEGTLSV